MAAVPELLLDPAIKIWVLLPISIVMVLVGILRNNVTTLFLSPKRTVPNVRLLKEQQHLGLLRTYRRNHHVFISQSDFDEKFEFFKKEYEFDHLMRNYVADPEKLQKLKENPNDFNTVMSDLGSGDMMMQMLKELHCHEITIQFDKQFQINVAKFNEYG
ncbi:unnamed protein product [Ambrosiozyma monospora]|uniref:ER membrane protein complex subunit 3 n=1 Tax=Ambrosiozyma monospora TaxID=43982 RepID=A0A9W6WBI0_AMBMO|nr:unnamed protein product [Ambrosiozyma monospora]